MYLVLLETSGNQSFIFSTNKLRENLGASELIYRTGTQWLLEAVEACGGPALWGDSAETMRSNLKDQQPSILESSSTCEIEVILAASGKALLLVKNQEVAKALIREVTHRTLRDAPGVDLCGVYEKITFEQSPDASAQKAELEKLSKLNGEIYEHLAYVRANRPGPQSRFQRLPVVSECVSSGLPANQLKPAIGDAKTWVGRSAVGLAKEGIRDQAIARLNGLDPKWSFAKDIDDLYKTATQGEQDPDREWVAIVHADGNGLGQIFLDFEQHISGSSPADYFKQLREFSIALDECTEAAFLSALDDTFKDWDKDKLPLVPLILGGDDLTVMCAGRFALPFTAAFLKAFERETQGHRLIGPIAESALGCDRLSACAGVAIVKPHFPFSIAYDLAEKLIKSAKAVKKTVLSGGEVYPCSAVDFHILYDSSNVDLDAIRDRLQQDGDLLYNKPYVVTPEDKLQNLDAESQKWVAQHRWETLTERVKALLETDKDSKRLLPNSQAHALRQSLFMGQAAADAQLNLIWQRYRDNDGKLKPLVRSTTEDGKSVSLFEPAIVLPSESEQEPDDNPDNSTISNEAQPNKPQAPPEAAPQLTGFLDAIEAVTFV